MVSPTGKDEIPSEAKTAIIAIAEGMGSRLDKLETDLDTRLKTLATKEQIAEVIERALSKQAEAYQGKIAGLERELTVIKNSLPPTHGDRRHEPTSFWETCYRYFCLAPVVERRR